MKIAVMKFGGTSLSTANGRECALVHIKERLGEGYGVVVVVSAMGRGNDPYSTDALISLVSNSSISSRDLDLLMSCGETISAIVLSTFLNSKKLKASPLSGSRCGIITDSNYGKSSIIRVESEMILRHTENNTVPVVTGFQGMNADGEITTLGRGGSDITAIALAAALRAELVEMYKDVEGAMTEDPRENPDAQVIEQISAQELLSMAISGSRLMHQEAIRIAIENQVTFHIRNNFSNKPGTTVYPDPDRIISHIAHNGKGK